MAFVRQLAGHVATHHSLAYEFDVVSAPVVLDALALALDGLVDPVSLGAVIGQLAGLGDGDGSDG
jgi:hypothetical protein